MKYYLLFICVFLLFACTETKNPVTVEKVEITDTCAGPIDDYQPSLQQSDELDEYLRTHSQPQQERVVVKHNFTPDDAYNEGYEEGYEQGKYDGEHGYSHGHNYDDSNDYYDYFETRYVEGYEEGYDEGYDDGEELYEEESD